jgi:AraC-like DNA-binding protein
MKKQDLPIQIDNYINSHLTEPIEITGICSHFKIGKTYLYEISKKIYGIGIAEHIRNLRILKAKTLLMRNPELNIKEVCFSCGFHDYDYFITVFKRTTGMSPAQFSNIERKNYTAACGTRIPPLDPIQLNELVV